MRDGSRPRYHDGFLRDDERLGFAGRVDFVANQVVNRNRAIENRAGAKDGAPLHDRSFIDSGISANQNFVFNDPRKRANRFKNATDLRSRGNMAVTADLRATSNERVGIDHGAFANVSPHVHEHRRHANHAAANVTAIANAGAARNNAHAVGSRERTRWIRRLVEEGLLHGINGHVRDGAHSKPQQNSLLHPGVRTPAGFRGRIGLSSPNLTAIQSCLEIAEEPLMFFFVMRRRFVKQFFNLRRLHAPSWRVRAIQAPPGCAPDSPPWAAQVASATPVRAGPFPPSRPLPGWDWTRRNLFPSADDSAGESRVPRQSRPAARAASTATFPPEFRWTRPK